MSAAQTACLRWLQPPGRLRVLSLTRSAAAATALCHITPCAMSPLPGPSSNESLPCVAHETGACACSWDYAGAVFVLGLVVTLAGQGVCYWLMDRLQRRSIIIFSMAGLLTLSSVVIYWEAVTAVMQAINTHTLLSFGSICSSESHQFSCDSKLTDCMALMLQP